MCVLACVRACKYIYKTECMCTLCLSCCTLLYSVVLCLSVSLAFLLLGNGGRIMTSFICNNSFTCVLRIIILDVSERAREKARGN